MRGLESLAKSLITSCYLAVGAITSDSVPEMPHEYLKKEVQENYQENIISNKKPSKETINLEEIVVDFDAAKKEFESKRIPVLMFHNFHERENRYTISPQNFEKLLYELYDNDFYSVSLKEYVKGDFSNVPVGKKPVLFTFDDASTGQFLLKNGEICDKSAVGIMEKFYEEHDFGKGGVFFISYGSRNNFNLPFQQNDLASEKMKILFDLGYDVAHHTIFHPDNTKASYNNMFEQQTLSSAMVHYLLGEERYKEIEIEAFAHPFGASPRNTRAFNHLENNYDAVFDAWGGPSRHPLSERFDPHRIPRIEITYHTKHLATNIRNAYKVTSNTKAYYQLKKLEDVDYDYASNKNYEIEKLPSSSFEKLKHPID